MEYITVYDKDLQPTALVESAFNVGYELKLNDISQASFSLGTGDPVAAALKPRAIVSIPDGGRELGLFRVIGMPRQQYGHGGVIEYSLEHVCATLMDDCLPGFLTLGGTGVTTADVIEALLARQSRGRWVLDECDFDDQFEYTFENTDLLSALLSVGNVLADPYIWVWDTSVYPWRVSLKRAGSSVDSVLLYRRNLRSVTKDMDATGQFTRIYPRGSGEGDNQVNIKSVNNGVEYLDATPTGEDPISTVYVDTSIETPELLKAAAARVLESCRVPYYSYSVEAVDYSAESGLRFDRHMPGDLVRVLDSEDEVELETRVVSVAKRDVFGDHGGVTITLANKSKDASGEMANLSQRMSVTQLYSQGATNLYAQQYTDNAGPQDPGVMRFYVPTECVRINRVLLSWRFAAFRGYTKGASAAGQVTVATTLGGETTLSAEGGTLLNTVPYSGGMYGAGGAVNVTGAADGVTGTRAAHVTSTEAAGAYEGHNHMVPAHSHDLNAHTHSIPAHVHSIDHQHQLPAHRHEVAGHTHAVEVAAHSHGNIYGIYTGTTASTATLKVDGVERLIDQQGGNEVDVTAYLEMQDGRIKRGVWHEIEIVPNALTRIEANLFVQLFVQSRGGGDY